MPDLYELLAAISVGLLVGFFAVLILMRRAAEAEARGRFAQWRATEEPKIRQEAVESLRTELKKRVGEGMAEVAVKFPFAPSDARFVGHPVTYVVFDGYADVQARSADELRAVVFVEATSPPGGPSDRSAVLVKSSLERRDVRWETLALRGEP